MCYNFQNEINQLYCSKEIVLVSKKQLLDYCSAQTISSDRRCFFFFQTRSMTCWRWPWHFYIQSIAVHTRPGIDSTSFSKLLKLNNKPFKHCIGERSKDTVYLCFRVLTIELIPSSPSTSTTPPVNNTHNPLSLLQYRIPQKHFLKVVSVPKKYILF